MEAYSSSKRQEIKSFIELLNELGFTIVSINGEFYCSTEFEQPNSNVGVDESQLIGRDVTTLVENAIDHRNISDLRKRELTTQINDIKIVRRRFHKDITYVVYSSQY